ncbi:MAG: FHA domain-containing protein [Crocinitomicaceae bacterium]|nr:FHA domain-containing protein [Crocinitomicaceae bacterium]
MDKIHLRIGSALDNQLVIESVDVAPYHLELFCDTSGNVFITDLGSEQGTFVNNRRLDGFKLLKKGDRVHFGQRHVFQWEDFIPKETSFYQEEEEPIMPPKKQA